jgi:hypothetical protein
MTLEEFRRTRVEMNQQQYHTLYDIDHEMVKGTAKLHVYEGALYIREMLDGSFTLDLDTNDYTPDTSLYRVEEDFWNIFAKNDMNPKPNLSVEAYTLLKNFREAQNKLLIHWLTEEDDADLMNEHYPEDVMEFEEMTLKLSQWVQETTKHA